MAWQLFISNPSFGNTAMMSLVSILVQTTGPLGRLAQLSLA